MKKAPDTPQVDNVSKPNPEGDFEMVLVINDDIDLSPSRLMRTTSSLTAFSVEVIAPLLNGRRHYALH